MTTKHLRKGKTGSTVHADVLWFFKYQKEKWSIVGNQRSVVCLESKRGWV